MKIILSVFVIVIVLFVAGLFFVTQPKNLGVRYTKANLDSIYGKADISFEDLPGDAPAGKTIIVEGAHAVDTEFTSEELTAAADNRSANYVYFPFRNVQIRVNGDGTVEGSAKVGFNDAVNYLVALGVPQEDIIAAAKKFRIPNATIPVYGKVSGKVENNVSDIKIHSVAISMIPVPQGLINQYGQYLDGLIENIIKERQPGTNFEKLEVKNGKVHFKGVAPDKEKAAKNLP